jgi:outer membrane protein insertion porin family
MNISHHFKQIALFLYCLFLCVGSLSALQFENQQIESIKILSNVPEGCFFDEKLVMARIKTKQGEFFSQSVFDNDLKILAAEYDRVEPAFEVLDSKIVITLKVWPKPMIRTIIWNGNCSLDSNTLQKELGITICTVFDRVCFNKAFHKLKAMYIKRGYFEAELNYDVKVDCTTNEVDISVTICEGRSGWISRIYFENFTECEEEEILEKMATKKFNPFLSWVTSEGLYNEEAVNYDQSQIINFLHDKGYADAVVKIDVVDSPHFLERIHLYIRANKGEAYTLGKITFSGNQLYTDDEVRNCFVIEEDGCFSPELLRATATRIEHLYGRRGFIDASVSFEPKLELDCGNVYSVDFNIEEGERFMIGMVKVFGNCVTQTNVILHETLLIPGDVFNSEKLEATEARLKNVGYFSNVNVYAVRTEEGSCLKGNYRDVHIEVEEKQTGRFGVFFGYSTVEALFGGINITESNFNSAGLGSLFSKTGPGLRGGGEHVNITASIGQKTSSYGLGWTKPYFMDTKWSVGFDIEKSTNNYISDD